MAKTSTPFSTLLALLLLLGSLPLAAQVPVRIVCTVRGHQLSATEASRASGYVVSLRDTIVFKVAGMPMQQYQINGLRITPAPCAPGTPLVIKSGLPLWQQFMPAMYDLRIPKFLTTPFSATTVLRIPVSEVLTRNAGRATITLPTIIRNPEQLDITTEVKHNSPLSYTFALASACSTPPQPTLHAANHR